jgi:hypothetical protein
MHKNYEKSNLNYSRKEETGWDGVLKIPLQYDILSNYFLNYGWKNNIFLLLVSCGSRAGREAARL